MHINTVHPKSKLCDSQHSFFVFLADHHCWGHHCNQASAVLKSRRGIWSCLLIPSSFGNPSRYSSHLSIPASGHLLNLAALLPSFNLFSFEWITWHRRALIQTNVMVDISSNPKRQIKVLIASGKYLMEVSGKHLGCLLLSTAPLTNCVKLKSLRILQSI